MVPILVREGQVDRIHHNLGGFLAHIISFIRVSNSSWQVNLHKLYGTCAARGCNKSNDVMDRANGIRYCRQKRPCNCKTPI